MKTPNDGGPAFPLTGDAVAYANRDFVMQGMSLRQWYAGRALANHDLTAGDTYEGVAKSCFKIADAMIAHERQEKEQS